MTAYRLDNLEYRQDDFVLRANAFRLQRGEIYAVTGPNGCGKTSLLHVLSLLGRPVAGQVCCGGSAVDFDDGPELLRARRRLAYLMQQPYLFNMTVYDNIAYGLNLRGIPAAARRQRVRDAIDRLKLGDYTRRNAHTLSGGEAQRVAVARTLVLDADVFLLDEFTAGIDQDYVRAVESYVCDINREPGATVVFTTHSKSQAHRLSRNRVSIVDGEVCHLSVEDSAETQDPSFAEPE